MRDSRHKLRRKAFRVSLVGAAIVGLAFVSQFTPLEFSYFRVAVVGAAIFGIGMFWYWYCYFFLR